MATGSGDIAAVCSRASSDYVRVRRPDGSFEPEYYVFGEGGRHSGGMKDETIDPLRFLDIAHVIAVPLADKGYLPAKDPAHAKFLIMVYWGITDVPMSVSGSQAYSNFSGAQAAMSASTGQPTSSSVRGAPGMSTAGVSSPSDAVLSQMSAATVQLNVENRLRDQIDFANAGLLGYDSEGVIGTDYGNAQRGLALGLRRDTLVSEIEDNRYFVVLMAYDFQEVWKEKKHKLVWETRFSMRSSGHDFARDLPKMARYAASYFGVNTKGLVRDAFPEGKVSIGEVKSMGAVEPPK
jgi:hypothetical protein